MVSRELYPFKSNFLTIGGHQYHYVDEGQGETLVMVHGNPTWSFYYRELIKRLSPSFRCIAPDHIGCGYSDKPDDARYRYTLKQRVDDLEACLDQLGLTENITLIVHDWGGMIGMAYAHRHPEAIKRLVVMNTAAFHLPPSKRFPPALWSVRDTALGAFMVRRFNAFSAIGARVAAKKPISADIRQGYTAPYNSWDNRIATLRFVQDIPLQPSDNGYDIVSDVQNNLSQFANTPLMIAWGMKDFVFDHHFLKEWETHLPHAQVYRFEDCGHYILEDAQNEVGVLIEQFLQAT
ncbi:MAG: alpha/beta fold hydrolase [Candidatus Promineifilaceae bacterium]